MPPTSTRTPTAGPCDATYGDLNGDGRTDALDMVVMSNYLAGNVQAGSDPFRSPLGKADVNMSGSVDAVDLVLLQNYLVGNINCLPRP